MNKKLYLLLLIPEFVIAISIIYSYINKLSLVKQGQIFSTVTGMDTMIAELLSVVLCVICIAFIMILSQAKANGALKTAGNFLLLFVSVGLIFSIIIFSSGKIRFDLGLLYLILGSTFLKLRQSYRNEGDQVWYNIMAYIFIYMGCFAVAVLIDLHFSDPANPFPFANMDQAAIHDDTLTALIYYSLIGLIIPIVKIIRQFTKVSVVNNLESIEKL